MTSTEASFGWQDSTEPMQAIGNDSVAFGSEIRAVLGIPMLSQSVGFNTPNLLNRRLTPGGLEPPNTLGALPPALSQKNTRRTF